MKKNIIKQLHFLPVLLSLCLFLSSCGGSGASSSSSSATTADPSQSASVSAPVSASVSAPASTSVSAMPYTELDILDMAGRRNTIPAKVQRIYCHDAAAALFVYAVAPDKLLGWSQPLTDSQKSLIPAPYNALPSFNTESESGFEALQKAKPEICFFAAEVLDESTKESADQLQKKLGIPVLVMGSSLQSTGLSLGFLGAALEEKEAGAALSSYADTLIKTTRTLETSSGSTNVYMGSGASSLEVKISPAAAEILTLLHASDLAGTAALFSSSYPASIPMEQLKKENPQIMLLTGDPKQNISGFDAAAKVMENPDFASIQAVKDKQVYGIPDLPFSWMDDPAGPNRLLGLQWLGQLLHPKVFQNDMKTETKNFYKLFYHVELTDQQLETIMPSAK